MRDVPWRGGYEGGSTAWVEHPVSRYPRYIRLAEKGRDYGGRI